MNSAGGPKISRKMTNAWSTDLTAPILAVPLLQVFDNLTSILPSTTWSRRSVGSEAAQRGVVGGLFARGRKIR